MIWYVAEVLIGWYSTKLYNIYVMKKKSYLNDLLNWRQVHEYSV